MKPILTSVCASPILTLRTDKFKTEMLTVSLPLPFEQRTARLCSLLFGIIKQGSGKYPGITEINRRLDDLYDANIATMFARSGDNVSAGFICECLGRKFVPDGEDLLRGTVETLENMLFDPLTDKDGMFPVSVTENEKKNLCDSIRASDNDPRIHSYQLCRGIMCEGEPYGLRQAGTVDDVLSVTREEIMAYRNEFFASSSPMLIYVGDREPSEVASLTEGLLSRFGKTPAALCDTVIKLPKHEMREVEEEMQVTQGKLTMGFRSDICLNDPDLYASIVFNDVFGGSATSKLFRNVREKQSLCYSCSSSLDFVKGVLFVRSGISNENKEKVKNEILKQLSEIQSGNVSDYEFECSKRSIENSYRQVDDSAMSLESYYRIRMLGGLDEDVDTAIEKLGKVTKEDVIRVSKRFIPDTSAFIRGTLSGDASGEEADDD